MTYYVYDPYTESINAEDCPGVEVKPNFHRCQGLGNFAIGSRTSEFHCGIDNCPLIGATALQSGLEANVHGWKEKGE
jgi:hypothetical protein